MTAEKNNSDFFSEQIYRLTVFYNQFVHFLTDFFSSGGLIIFSDEATENYSKLLDKIREILSQECFKDLADENWYPFKSLVYFEDFDIEWKERKEDCYNFLNRVNHLYITNGKKKYPLTKTDQQIFNTIQKCLKKLEGKTRESLEYKINLFKQQISLLKKLWEVLMDLLKNCDAGSFFIVNEKVQEIYIKLYTKIEEIITWSAFEDLSQIYERPFKSLYDTPENLAKTWNEKAEKIVNSFYGKIMEVYTLSGKPAFVESPEDKKFFEEVKLALANFKSYKLQRLKTLKSKQKEKLPPKQKYSLETKKDSVKFEGEELYYIDRRHKKKRTCNAKHSKILSILKEQENEYVPAEKIIYKMWDIKKITTNTKKYHKKYYHRLYERIKEIKQAIDRTNKALGENIIQIKSNTYKLILTKK
ncbi:MAG: hypothetical protein AB1349_09250 [Elusimicrobiota bacterium]